MHAVFKRAALLDAIDARAYADQLARSAGA